ncbi:DnaD domain protein [Metamycoplasma equirhinis]|uniref:DnaD domain protein n=1 Tax=Metamycoplasma equirhinis TaxID=92402 RepID=UPI0035937EC6
MNNGFYIENSTSINSNDLQNLRLFYGPIIGNNAILLYEHLLDLHNLYAKNQRHDFCETFEFLLLDENLLASCKEKLEGVGLLKTYQISDGSLLLELLKPLSANQFIKNEFLSCLSRNKIGEKKFLEIMAKKAEICFDKTKMKEVSRKSFDVFDIKAIDFKDKPKCNISFTIHDFELLKDIVTPEEFIVAFTELELSPTQILMINRLKQLKFDSASINSFIYYSIRINNAIVCKYIETIANDYAKRNLFNAQKIDLELKTSYMSKTNHHKFQDLNEARKYSESDILEISNEEEWEN